MLRNFTENFLKFSGKFPEKYFSGKITSVVGGHLVLSLHSSNEPGELSQWRAMITAPQISSWSLLLLLLLCIYCICQLLIASCSTGLCVCCGWWQTDEDGEIYMSVMKLRDETDELQMELERRERSGDMRGIEACKQQLNRKQQLLLEKNKIRSDYYFTCCHYFRELKNCSRFAAV